MEGEIITLQDVFRFDHALGFDDQGRSLGVLRSTGLRPTFLDKLASYGIYVDSSLFAFEALAVRDRAHRRPLALLLWLPGPLLAGVRSHCPGSPDSGGRHG